MILYHLYETGVLAEILVKGRSDDGNSSNDRISSPKRFEEGLQEQDQAGWRQIKLIYVFAAYCAGLFVESGGIQPLSADYCRID